MSTLAKRTYRRINALVSNRRGQGLVEYALILVLIAIAVITALTAVGQKTSSVYTNIGTNLNQ